MIQPGTWWISSKKDPRWCASGRADVGMFVMPTEVSAKIDELKRSFGEPPDDVTWGYEKD